MRVLTAIVGARFRPGALKRIETLKVGEQVLLVREPNNPFDKHAVAVKTVEGVQLGFIPKTEAPLIAKALDEFYGPEAVVTGVSSNPSIAVTWEN